MAASKRIFNELKDQLEVISYPFDIRPTTKPKRGYHLHTLKSVTIQGRAYNELYFAGIIEQKEYIGFYFMPLSMVPALKSEIPPILLKLLTGKSCFHIRELTPELEVAIRKTLRAGVRGYRTLGWL